MTDSLLELYSLFEANNKFQMSADIEKDNKLRDLRFLLEDFKDQIIAHEDKIKH
jgi:hypothetical protein